MSLPSGSLPAADAGAAFASPEATPPLEPAAAASSDRSTLVMASGVRIISSAEGLALAGPTSPQNSPSGPRCLRVACKEGPDCKAGPNRPKPTPPAAADEDPLSGGFVCPFLHLRDDATLCHFICESAGRTDYQPFQAKLDIFRASKPKNASRPKSERVPLATMYQVQCKRGDKMVYVCFAQLQLKDLSGGQMGSAGVCIPAGYTLDEESGRLWYGEAKPDLSTAVAQPNELKPLPVSQTAGGISFAEFFRIGTYDLRVLPGQLSDVYGKIADGAGWRVDCTRATWSEVNDEDQVTLNVSITGHFNVGKTWLLERLTGLPLPSGSTTHTEGLCFVIVPISGSERLCIADQIGQNSPSTHLARSTVSRFGLRNGTKAHVDPTADMVQSARSGASGCRSTDEVREKISRMQVRENFFNNVAVRFGNVYLHVVSSMRHSDQLHIHSIARRAMAQKRRVDIFVVHNLKGMHDAEFEDYVGRVRELFALREVTLKERTADGKPFDVTRLDSHMDGVGVSTVSIQHLFLRCELEPANTDGKGPRRERMAWNATVIGYLRRRIDNILESRREGTRKRIARVLTECQRFFAQPTTAQSLPRLDFAESPGTSNTFGSVSVEAVDGLNNPADVIQVKSTLPSASYANPDFRYNVVRTKASGGVVLKSFSSSESIVSNGVAALQLELPGLSAECVDYLKEQFTFGKKGLRKEVEVANGVQSNSLALSATVTETMAPGLDDFLVSEYSDDGRYDVTCIARSVCSSGTRPAFGAAGSWTRSVPIDLSVETVAVLQTHLKNVVEPHAVYRNGIFSMCFAAPEELPP